MSLGKLQLQQSTHATKFIAKGLSLAESCGLFQITRCWCLQKNMV